MVFVPECRPLWEGVCRTYGAEFSLVTICIVIFLWLFGNFSFYPSLLCHFTFPLSISFLLLCFPLFHYTEVDLSRWTTESRGPRSGPEVYSFPYLLKLYFSPVASNTFSLFAWVFFLFLTTYHSLPKLSFFFLFNWLLRFLHLFYVVFPFSNGISGSGIA